MNDNEEFEAEQEIVEDQVLTIGGEDVNGETFEEYMDEDDNPESNDLDDIADVAIDILQRLLSYFEVGDITIDEYEGDEGELILDITGDDLAVLIGHHGKTLDALQFITSILITKELGYRYPVVVDVEGYKNRQRQRIEAMAKSMANKVVSQNHSISMKPMTPYERRIVHVALKNDDRVKTNSEDEGPNRHIVITPA